MPEDIGRLTRQEHNILVVDSNQLERDRIMAALASQGYILDSARTREEAEGKIGNNVYSVVIFDYTSLPQNGSSFLDFIRTISPDTIPIVTTTQYNEDLEARVLEVGAYIVLDKPIKPARLQANVANATRFRRSYYDNKTGFYISDVLFERIGEEIDSLVGRRIKAVEFSTRREEQPQYLSVLLIDLDNFKHINDTYGHIEGGDVVLRRVANEIRKNGRSTDIFGRYGGDELVAALPGLPYESAMARAEKMRSDIERLSIRSRDGKIIPATGTIGVVTIPEKGVEHTIEGVLEAADAALYHGKLELGRNRVIGYRDLPNT